MYCASCLGVKAIIIIIEKSSKITEKEQRNIVSYILIQYFYLRLS